MKYVVIGNSAAAVGCIEGIRSVDRAGSITLISDEPHAAYGRPLISYLLMGRTDLAHMNYRPADFYETMGVTAMLGRRAAEIDADAILLAKNIDGVYSADPKKDPTAVKYDTITYDDVLAQHLQVMDSTATSLSMDNKIPVILFALKDPENILRVVMGEKIGTIVKEEP